VKEAFEAQPRIADVLYCAAGGNHAENGFFVDIDAEQIDRCMKNNYYATVYPTKVLVDMWTKDDRENRVHDCKLKLRQVVIVSSAAAFLALPGSIAYTRKDTSAPSILGRR
jgi:3-dehydrosphinganine reductase